MAISAIGLHLLPVELQQAIFFQLHRTDDISAAALTCRSLLLAFLDAKSLIENKVLRNEIRRDVLPEALAVLNSARMLRQSQRSVSSIQEFLEENFTFRIEPHGQLASADVYALSRLNDLITRIARRYIACVLKESPGGQEDVGRRPSKDEVARVHRAFYRFELWCNLFRTHKTNETILEPDQQREVFFDRFSPWENEQLACINDYLARAILPAFNDVAEHDIDWGAVRVDYGDDISTGFIQYALSMGLVKIHQIITAQTFEARRKLLRSDDKIYPNFNLEFLFDCLEHASRNGLNHTPLQRYTTEDNATHLRKPFFDDPDSGPESCWRWAHAEDYVVNFVNSPWRISLRKWGYVMWDRATLDSWKVLQTRWDAPSMSERRAATELRAKLRAEQEFSFRRRYDIQRAGGSGWWSVGDESKVTWPYRRTRKPQVVEKKPESLADAKRAILSIKLPTTIPRAKNQNGV
ncbi:hypothetical protein K505DRAFT_302244 [Melanomma pulvis-pyrius CBS 109.77]|uniref:F-box domain-containing protein n=1 Tax=Melanomma pulvis-pyrius CBS 109.77 TaxID=1314802 RepID=A0A6A6XH02_9PLEO|nr:hypothetical protein K505DRAFT_302244 [Melanomma pulvis-pyrius CBS 109.77]